MSMFEFRKALNEFTPRQLASWFIKNIEPDPVWKKIKHPVIQDLYENYNEMTDKKRVDLLKRVSKEILVDFILLSGDYVNIENIINEGFRKLETKKVLQSLKNANIERKELDKEILFDFLLEPGEIVPVYYEEKGGKIYLLESLILNTEKDFESIELALPPTVELPYLQATIKLLKIPNKDKWEVSDPSRRFYLDYSKKI